MATHGEEKANFYPFLLYVQLAVGLRQASQIQTNIRRLARQMLKNSLRATWTDLTHYP